MNLFQRFCSDQRGNFAILFGLALIPVAGMVGAAVDYSRANAVRAALQAAADAAALAVARDAPGLSEARIAERARAIFAANFNRKDATLGPIEVVKGHKTIRVAASATVKTSIMAIMQVDTIKVATAGEVAWGKNRIELALVLDNTGSMASAGKMPALKAAVRDLLADLERSTDRDAIKISIVPFDTQVNIGTRFRRADWLTFNAALPGHLRVERRHWEGCVVDRDKPDDGKDYGGSSRSDYPAATCETGSLAQLQPLTNDFRALRDTVDAMRPSGYTNITIGMAWGLASLSRGEPLAEAEPYDTRNLTKYMVVLTDGDNTRNRFTADEREIDARTRLACREVKDKGVKLFTIRVVEGNRQLLRDCASTTEHVSRGQHRERNPTDVPAHIERHQGDPADKLSVPVRQVPAKAGTTLQTSAGLASPPARSIPPEPCAAYFGAGLPMGQAARARWSASPANSPRPSVQPIAGSTWFSGCGIIPSTFPRSLTMPAMALSEPLWFQSRSTLPFGSQ